MASKHRVRKIKFNGYLISATDATKIHKYMAKFDITLDAFGEMIVKDPLDGVWKILLRSDLVKMVTKDKVKIGLGHLSTKEIPSYVDATIAVISKIIEKGDLVTAVHEVPDNIPTLEVEL